MTRMSPQPLVTLADIRPRAIDDWPRYREEGEQLLQLAERAHGRHKKAFTTTILYNLVAMAIEKLVMAALMRCGQLPDNHTPCTTWSRPWNAGCRRPSAAWPNRFVGSTASRTSAIRTPAR